MPRTMKQLVSDANEWREQYNPLRGLTISRAITLLEAGQRGDYADLQWTYEFVEQTDADLFTLVERRTAALTEMDWDINVVGEEHDAYDKALAEDQAGEPRAAYERIDNLYESIAHFEMAMFRGYSIGQLHPAAHPDQVEHVECLNHWNFCRKGRDGNWYWNPKAQSTTAQSLGEAARQDPEKHALIVHTTRRPIDRIGLIKYVRANLSEKDWDGYVEIYGIPSWIIVGPEHVPEGKEAEYRDAAEDVAAGGSGYLPHGSDAKAADTPRGSQPFETRLEWLTKKLVLAGTGGLLTVLAESGSGTLAGNAHMEAFRMIARMDAAKISELYQRSIDRAILNARFPDRPHLAYFDIAAEEEQDVGEIVKQITELSRFYLIDPTEVAEKTGYRIIGVRQQVPQPDAGDRSAAQHRAPASGLQRLARERADQVHERLLDNIATAAVVADRRDLRPLAERLYAALHTEQPQAMYSALADLKRDLPDLAGELLADPEMAAALEGGLGAAMANGMAEGAAARGGTS